VTTRVDASPGTGHGLFLNFPFEGGAGWGDGEGSDGGQGTGNGPGGYTNPWMRSDPSPQLYLDVDVEEP
jgi:hypothetical protein